MQIEKAPDDTNSYSVLELYSMLAVCLGRLPITAQTVGDHHPAGQPDPYHMLHTVVTGK